LRIKVETSFRIELATGARHLVDHDVGRLGEADIGQDRAHRLVDTGQAIGIQRTKPTRWKPARRGLSDTCGWGIRLAAASPGAFRFSGHGEQQALVM
jgi:hypothetical protein